MNIIVRPYTQKDLDWIVKADKDFPHPWSDNAWQNLSPTMSCFVAEVQEVLVGYALYQHLEGEDKSHLLKIYLLPQYRSSGASDTLFQESVKGLRVNEVFLEVAESNVAAQRFYEKIGFIKIHLAKNFYSNGENAWFMLLTR